MLRHKLTTADYFLIAANLLPVAGVWEWGWSPKEVFLVYCLETILIGIFNLFKLGLVTAIRKEDTWYNGGGSSQQSGFLFIFFFLFHYGFFVAIQMGIFFSVSGIGAGHDIGFFNFFFQLPELMSRNSWYLLGTFIFCYLYKTIIDFVVSGEYKTISMSRLMFQPYGRIFIQQFTVILGSAFLSFGAGKIFILIFALIKIYFEILLDLNRYINRAAKIIEERQKLKDQRSGGSVQ